ncbi:hypothetical protein [Streptomyces sp. 8N706]|uniref:hypothetical protein n=1 Tax=Streptomyces sp. 8N706 TaxID=3457416 RepID=UPI003FD05FEB
MTPSPVRLWFLPASLAALLVAQTPDEEDAEASSGGAPEPVDSPGAAASTAGEHAGPPVVRPESPAGESP